MDHLFSQYQLILQNANESLAKHCWRKGKSLYGNPLPNIVAERLKKELKAIARAHHSSDYLIGCMIVGESLSEGFPVSSRGLIGSSFVAFLCGITAVNPLPPHYYCPKCQLFVLANTYYIRQHLLGYDLPSKRCPKCGMSLKTDGAGIMPEIMMGGRMDRDPNISVNLAQEVRPKIVESLKRAFGQKNVFRAGVKTVLSDGSIYRTVHPGGFFILPEGARILDLTPIRPPSPDDEIRAWITEDDYRNLYNKIQMYSLFSYPSVSILHQLEENTGIASSEITINDEEIVRLFLKKGFSFLPGHHRDWKEAAINEDLLTNRPAFTDLCRATALMHGTRTWEHNGEILLKQGRSLHELIAYRDDIMDDLLEKGVKPQRCFEIMDYVRRGIGLTRQMEYDMREFGFPEWYIGSCNTIGYVFPKSHILELMLFYWKLAYYRVYYPFEYKQALKAFDL